MKWPVKIIRRKYASLCILATICLLVYLKEVDLHMGHPLFRKSAQESAPADSSSNLDEDLGHKDVIMLTEEGEGELDEVDVVRGANSLLMIVEAPTRTDTASAMNVNDPTRTDTASARNVNDPTRTDTASARNVNVLTRTDTPSARNVNAPSTTDTESAGIVNALTTTDTPSPRSVEAPVKDKHKENFTGQVPLLYDIKRPSGNQIQILLWEMPHALDYNGDLEGCNLPFGKSCIFTEDKEMYNETEAVMISILHSRENIPLYRFPFHKWVFREMEPPPHVWSLRYWGRKEYIYKFGKIFNLTSTTNLDSDVMTGPIFRPCEIVPQKWTNEKDAATNYAEGKSHRVAWFVSHCVTQSRRMDYVKELQKYIPVDIYGVCGNMTCADNAHRQDCDMTLLKDKYKFYLSFENSICKAYVTEKLSRITEKPVPIIPIVLGGVNYSFILPEETYIDVKNFSSPKELAEFLKRIDGDDDLFNHYMYRKLSLACHRYPHTLKPFGCRMCQHLHEKRNEVEIAPDVTEFYSPEKQCKRPEEYYRGLTLAPSPRQWIFEW